MFEPNTFIRWSHKDESGNFSHVGLVLPGSTDDVLSFLFFENNIGFEASLPIPFEGKVKTSRKPTGWDELFQARDSYIPPICIPSIKQETQPPKRERIPLAGSKKVLGKQIFEETSGRSDIIQRFMEELDMTKAGAATYYANYNSGRW